MRYSDNHLAMCLPALSMILISALKAAPQDCGGTWIPGDGYPGLGGAVYAMTTWDPDGPGPQPPLLIVGGSLQYAISTPINNIVAWDGTSWQTLGSGIGPTALPFVPSEPPAPVMALTVYNGELIAAGSFVAAGGATANGVARWNGTSWQPLGAGFDQTVRALAVWDPDGPGPQPASLIAGGDFAMTSSTHVARWDEASSSWQPFGAGMNATYGFVDTLAIYNGEVVAGGYFGAVSGNNLAHWDGTFWRALGGGTDGTVYALTLFPDDPVTGGDTSLYVGGLFTTVGGVSINNIARWTGGWGSAAGCWGSPCGNGAEGGAVYALTIFNGDLVVGGGFDTANGVSAKRVARRPNGCWQPLGNSGLATTYAMVRAMASFNGELVVAGGIAYIGGVTSGNIIRWNPAGAGSWESFGPGGASFASIGGIGLASIEALTVYNGDLVAGGGFVDGGVYSGVVRRNGATWQPLDNCGQQGCEVRALTVFNGELVAGGEFTSIGGTNANHVARWNGTAWQPLGSGLGFNVHALTVHGGMLFAGGNSVARWDGAAWTTIGSGFAYALATYNGELVAGGSFPQINGVPVNSVAGWDGTSWHAYGSGIAPFASIRALAVYNGDLIAAGNFTTDQPAPGNAVARWDGTSWQPLGIGMLPGEVFGLAVYNGELFAGGNFNKAGDALARDIALWGGSSWRPLGLGTYGYVHALVVHGDDLVVAGEFDYAGGELSIGWARWHANPAVPVMYVKQNAIGTPHDGTSWGNAFTDLNQALCNTGANGGVTSELWVAAGTYKPTSTTDRTISFRPANGVTTYGGFAGNETSLSDRNPAANLTILSGDIGMSGDPSDNSLHVVDGTGIDATAILDGFTIQDGNADSGYGGGVFSLAGGPTLHNCTIRNDRGNAARDLASLGGEFSFAGVTLQGTGPPDAVEANLTRSAISLAGPWSLANERLDVFGADLSGPGPLQLGADALLRVRTVVPEQVRSMTTPSLGNSGAVFFAPFTTPSGSLWAQWNMTAVPVVNLAVTGRVTRWMIAPAGTPAATLTWTGNYLSVDYSPGGTADAAFSGNGALTISGRLYDVGGTNPVLIYDGTLPGNAPLLTASVEGFRVHAVPGSPDHLEFVEQPRVTPNGGFLVTNDVNVLTGRQLISMVFPAVQQQIGNYVGPPQNFGFSSTISLLGPAQFTLLPETPDSVVMTTHSDIRGQGSIEIWAGAQLTVTDGATIDLSNTLPGTGCADQCQNTQSAGTIAASGTLLVSGGHVQNTHVTVTLGCLENSAQIANNDITLAESVQSGAMGSATTGFGGEFFVQGNSTICCNHIVSEGDRYLDLDPDPAGAQPMIQNNQIEVLIKNRPVSNALGELLELRAHDYDPAADDCVGGACRLQVSAAPLGGGYTGTWVLERLELEGHPDPQLAAKLNLTNRQGFVFEAPPEALYVKDLILGENAVLNTGLQRLYYQTLTMAPGAQIIDIPVLGFSLKIIAFDDPTPEPANEFNIRVRTRVLDDSALDSSLPTTPLGVVQRLPSGGTDDSGVMEIATHANAHPSAMSVSAKGAFARAGEDSITIAFDYRFLENPDVDLVVYLSDDPNVGQSLVEVAHVHPPISGPGSIGSGAFAQFYGEFPRGSLNFHRGTYVELKLAGADARVWIDNWDPQINCGSDVCGDLNFSMGVDSRDYLLLFSTYGLDYFESNGQNSPGCLDSMASRDKYTDLTDLVHWDAAINGMQDLCAVEPGSLPNANAVSVPANSLIVSGKPSGANQQNDALYTVTATGNGPAVSGMQAEASGALRGNGRLVSDALGNIYELHALQGLYKLSNPAPSGPLIAPAALNFQGKTVHIGITSSAPASTFGLPLDDVAFHPTDPSLLYVAPVQVTPAGGIACHPNQCSGCNSTRAAARLRLSSESGASCNGTYCVDQLYEPTGGMSPFGCGVFAADERRGVREIEVSHDGANVFIGSAFAFGDNDWMLVFAECPGAGCTPALTSYRTSTLLASAGLPLKAPTMLTAAHSADYLYVASAASPAPGDTLPIPGQMQTTTVARTRVFRFQTGAGLVFSGAVDIANPFCSDNASDVDPALGCMSEITGISEDASGGLWICGFTAPKRGLTSSYNQPPFTCMGGACPLPGLPTLAHIPPGFGGWTNSPAAPPAPAAISASRITGGGLALPLGLAVNGHPGCNASLDFDGNGHRDLRDTAAFQRCFKGGGALFAPGCDVFDSECDMDVDLSDYHALQPLLSGP